MATYQVHLYPLFRVSKVVEADSPEQAAEIAVGTTDFYAKSARTSLEYVDQLDDEVIVDRLHEDGQTVIDSSTVSLL